MLVFDREYTVKRPNLDVFGNKIVKHSIEKAVFLKFVNLPTNFLFKIVVEVHA